MILKCRNSDVIHLDTGEVVNRSLLPISEWEYRDVCDYLERRIYTQSNKIARTISQRPEERNAFKLGLSDSYWVSFDQNVKFEDISPYYQEFGTLLFANGFTEPTLQLGGTFENL